MKGIPFMTGCVTIIGFSFLTMRISAKHSYINDDDGDGDIDLSLYDPDSDPDSYCSDIGTWYYEV